jgi:cardiolipin synthase
MSELATAAVTQPEKRPDGNRFVLLENGEQYFPAVFAAIAAAQREVLIETFILFEDEVGKQLHATLIAAAKRGVSVDITVDGYGSPDLSESFVAQLTAAGVRLHIFDPQPRVLGLRTNIFRRMHRKIVSVDGEIAFIGGINFGADHLIASGAKAKQDYAVRIDGPLANEIHVFAQHQAAAFYRHRPWWKIRGWRARWHDGAAILTVRDNETHRDEIERHYRRAIVAAKHDVLIACAYFFPGYRFLRLLRRAAQRGVKVRLILQGAPDMPRARTWAMRLYPRLIQAGVDIYEYCERPLHAKVAAIDDEWCTIGSSNLDPLSLTLNLEANVVVRDAALNRELRHRLNDLLKNHCRPITEHHTRASWWTAWLNAIAYHCTRYFPRWAGWLPAHAPKLHSIQPDRTTTLRFARELGVVSDRYSR